ncbi:MAG: superoxide dismutase [Fe] [Bdellovibrionaceae bacterium]|nr:superoxide dismutase [Fe] [Pseudobdellovibrionaceae bacterium]
MTYELPPLPYALDALAPHMSKETLEYHHGKHHKTYVDNLNKLVPGSAHDGQDLETLVKTASGPIFNNAAQVWNHTFFWNCLSPQGGGEPKGELARALARDFGSVAEFKDKFADISIKQFGSGWGWLVQNREGRLQLVSTSNAGCPLTEGLTPLLTCDVWEHAYYIDHRNRRPDYLAAFWKIVNWDFAQKNLR